MDKPILPHEIRKIYDGRIFRVVVETVTLPKGHQMNVELIRHPGSVVILPVTSEGGVVLVRQYRHASGRWMWELPAGSLKKDEDPDDAAVRECHEEIGMVPAKVERLGRFFPTPGYCDEEMILYKATGLRAPADGDTAQPDEDEDIEPRAFALDDLRRMIDIGEIVDLKTVAGVFLIDR
ncbi:MAG: NUDIX hydrolase [Vicinamibacterales bacterium]